VSSATQHKALEVKCDCCGADIGASCVADSTGSERSAHTARITEAFRRPTPQWEAIEDDEGVARSWPIDSEVSW